jgi:hypothetical protein
VMDEGRSWSLLQRGGEGGQTHMPCVLHVNQNCSGGGHFNQLRGGRMWVVWYMVVCVTGCGVGRDGGGEEDRNFLLTPKKCSQSAKMNSHNANPQVDPAAHSKNDLIVSWDECQTPPFKKVSQLPLASPQKFLALFVRPCTLPPPHLTKKMMIHLGHRGVESFSGRRVVHGPLFSSTQRDRFKPSLQTRPNTIGFRCWLGRKGSEFGGPPIRHVRKISCPHTRVGGRCGGVGTSCFLKGSGGGGGGYGLWVWVGLNWLVFGKFLRVGGWRGGGIIWQILQFEPKSTKIHAAKTAVCACFPLFFLRIGCLLFFVTKKSS